MFIIDTDLEINWLLPATVAEYVHTDFDVIVKNPDGDSIYIEGSTEPGGAIKAEDFIAPTPSTIGGVTYKFTPDIKGVWVVILTQGTDAFNTIYNEYFLRVSEPDDHIYQQVRI